MIKFLQKQKNLLKNFKYTPQLASQLVVQSVYSLQQNGYQQSNFGFYANQFYFSTSVDYYQLVKKLQIDSSDNIDTPQLMDKFYNQVKEINDLNNLIIVCVYYSNILRVRMEFDLAIQILSVAQKKMARDATFGHYKRKEMFLNYMTGNFLEVKIITDQILKDLMGSKDVQFQAQQIESIIQLADEIILCNQFDTAASIFQLMLEQLEKIKDQNIEQLVGKAYMGLACIYYTLQEYEEAVRYSILFYELNKEQNLEGLTIAYISFKELDLQEQANSIFQIIIRQANLDEKVLNKQKYILHSELFNYTNVFQNQIDQIVRVEAEKSLLEKNREKKVIWEEEKEVQKISSFIQSGNIEEGIKHYEELLKQLDHSESDYFLRIQILEVIGSLYSSKKDYNKAIEICLELHQKLLEKRNYFVLNDKKHLNNYKNLCDNYIKINDDNKAIDWHNKYHSFLLINRHFTSFSQIVRSKLLGHMDCLVRLQKYDDALEYADFIEKYANQFQNEKEYSQFYTDLKSRKLQILKFMKKNQELKKEYQTYYEFLRVFKNKEAFYQCLVYLLNFSFQEKNEQAIIKYSKDYLSIRDQFEKEDENLQNRKLMYLLLINYNYEKKEYQTASKYISDAKSVFLKNKLIEELYLFLIIQICIIKNLNLQENLDQKVQEAENLFSQHFKGTNLESIMRAKGYLYQSKAHFDLKDYENCLNHIEKLLKQSESKDLFQQELIDLLKNLQQIDQYKQKVEEIISNNQLNNHIQ